MAVYILLNFRLLLATSCNYKTRFDRSAFHVAYSRRGLNTVNLSTVNTAQQVILFYLIITGSAIFVSGFVVHVRERAFERRLLRISGTYQPHLEKDERGAKHVRQSHSRTGKAGTHIPKRVYTLQAHKEGQICRSIGEP